MYRKKTKFICHRSAINFDYFCLFLVSRLSKINWQKNHVTPHILFNKSILSIIILAKAIIWQFYFLTAYQIFVINLNIFPTFRVLCIDPPPVQCLLSITQDRFQEDGIVLALLIAVSLMLLNTTFLKREPEPGSAPSFAPENIPIS